MLVLFLFLSVILYLSRKRVIGTKKQEMIRFILIAILVVSEISLTIWYNYTDYWNPADTLPLQLCSISLLLSVLMLITRNFFLFEVTYFLGVGGALQALITPELFYDFPHYRYFHFFLAHIAIILASFYMIWIEKYYPTHKSIIKAFVTLNVVALFVFFVNIVTNGNYMFLSRKPSNPSLIDFLGPYPWYIISLELVAISIFILLYFPFVIFKRKKRL